MKKNFTIVLFLMILVISCGCTNSISRPSISNTPSITPYPVKTISPYSMMNAYAEIGTWVGERPTEFEHEYLWTIWVTNNGTSTGLRCNDGLITKLYYKNTLLFENDFEMGNYIIPPNGAIEDTSNTYGAVVDELIDDPGNAHLTITIDCKNNGRTERHLTTGPLPSWKELPIWYEGQHYKIILKPD